MPLTPPRSPSTATATPIMEPTASTSAEVGPAGPDTPSRNAPSPPAPSSSSLSSAHATSSKSTLDSTPPSPSSSSTSSQKRRGRKSQPPKSAASTAPAGPEATDLPPLARPYCFFPLSNNPRHSEVREPEPIPDDVYLHPDDDPGATRGIPIFKPTMEEFKQFDVYMESVRPWGERSSIVKIIPPKEWVDGVELLDKRAMSQLEIRSPIEQRMKGQNGVFVQLNVERNRNHPLRIHEWFNKCRSHVDLRTPNPKEGDRSLNRDSQEAKALAAQRVAEIKAERQAKREAAARRKLERERKKKAEEEAKEAAAKLGLEPGPTNNNAAGPNAADAASGSRANSAPTQTSLSANTSPARLEHSDDLPALDSSSHTSHSSGEPLATTPRSDPLEPPIDPFYDEDWKTAWLPEGITEDDFDVAGCSRIESKFWKSLGTGKKDSWYGADLAGSLFADENYPWNVANLPNLLNKLPSKIPGVNSPYLYFGMWRAAFSWHVEDMDLFSINYIHFGAPKLWYAVPQSDSERFESLVRSYFPKDANECDQFMRHKACTVSPFKLHSEGIRVNKLVHHQNEFVVTFPRGYHAGFNLGFNCAESVNFALPSWLELGKKAKACHCVDFSVRIDVDLLTGAKVPSPSPSPSPAPEPQRRKRKSEGEAGSAKRKRIQKVEPQIKEESPSPPPPLRIVIRLPSPQKVLALTPKPQVALVREPPQSQCVLCPSLATDDLAPVADPDEFIKSMSKTPTVQAHTSCAVALPEAYTEDWIEDDALVTYVHGLENIDRARWKLRCSSCVDKRSATVGTKVQCTYGRCTRAFHVPCARNNDEVHYFAGEKPVENADSAEGPTKFVFELLCPTHNPAAKEIRKRKAAEQLRQKVLTIPPESVVKFKLGGATLLGRYMDVDEEAREVSVRTSDFHVQQVPWSSLDFPPDEPKIENEHALPPKRNRKEGPPLPELFVNPMVYNDRKTGGPQEPAFIPPNPAEYYGTLSSDAPANAVRLIDSKAPHTRHYLPYELHGPGPMVIDHLRGLPPAVAYGPRIAVPPVRVMSFGVTGPAPGRIAAPVAPLPRMMATNGAPQGNGAPPVGGWPPPQRPAGPPGAQPPQLPTIPGGVGKIDLGLDRMIALMGKLPPLTVPAFHLAGTNGKGSVSVILESCLNAAGMKTARYNSPHLLEPRDAVRINGQPVSAGEYASAIAHVQRVSDENRLDATTFEIGTAAAFLIANTCGADVMIIECGMGGLRDATNVIPPQLVLASGLTSVGLDHTDRLGDTIAKIAREKASICVRGGVIVTAPHLHPDALAAARAVASERVTALVESLPSQAAPVAGGISMSLAPFRPPPPTAVATPLRGAQSGVLHTHLSLGGAHQLDNLSLALTMLDVVRNDQRANMIQPKLRQLTDAVLQSGVAAARWHGRCAWLQWNDNGQTIPFLVDGAHNADSAVTLRAYLDSLNVPGSRTFVLSLSASPGKSPDGVLGPLLRDGDRVAITKFTTPVEGMPWIKCAEAEAIRAAAAPLVGAGEIRDIPGAGPAAVADALRWANSSHGLTVVCGSLYLVAEAYRLVGEQ